jgi:outer membrane protein OmpA-like peptidoglycan-associated protein
MPSSAVAAGRLALVMLAIGAAPGCVHEPREANELGALQAAASSSVIVHPARVPVMGSPPADERMASLRPPPPGPIESRLLPLPDGGNRLPGQRRRDRMGEQVKPPGASSGPPASVPPTAAVFATSPVSPVASGEVRSAAALPPDPASTPTKPAGEPAPSSDGTPIALISFAGRSANLTDDTKSQLDKIAKSITDKKLRRIELRAFASGNDFDSRKVALARALVVRAYLIDSGVKSRIEVGSFAGEGEHVEILSPKT